jgi:hypothetical protein
VWTQIEFQDEGLTATAERSLIKEEDSGSSFEIDENRTTQTAALSSRGG